MLHVVVNDMNRCGFCKDTLKEKLKSNTISVAICVSCSYWSQWLMISTGKKVKYQALSLFYYHGGGNFHGFILIDRLISHICYRLIKTSCLLSGRWFYLRNTSLSLYLATYVGRVTRMPSSSWRQLTSIILKDKHIDLQWNSEIIHCTVNAKFP